MKRDAFTLDTLKLFYNNVCNTIFDAIMVQNEIEIDTIITLKNYFTKAVFEDFPFKNDVIISDTAIKLMLNNPNVFDSDYLQKQLEQIEIDLNNIFENSNDTHNIHLFDVVGDECIQVGNSDFMEYFVFKINADVLDMIENQVNICIDEFTESE